MVTIDLTAVTVNSQKKAVALVSEPVFPPVISEAESNHNPTSFHLNPRSLSTSNLSSFSNGGFYAGSSAVCLLTGLLTLFLSARLLYLQLENPVLALN